MVRYFAPLLLLGPALSAYPPQWAQFLPATANIKAMQADVQGNIYLAGSMVPSALKGASDTSDAFVAKYSSDGVELFSHTFGGSSADHVNALTIGNDGSVYLAGNTSSGDFPATGAVQLAPAAGSGGPFLVKLDPSGTTVFSYVYGLDTSFAAIAVDGHGQAVVTGYRTSGATPGLVAKLSQDGTRVLFTFADYGGAAVALDSDGNIYVAGVTLARDPAMTPGAFQTTHGSQPCGYSGFFGVPCVYQHIAKISADGSKLVYATFLDGTYGAAPSAIVLDAAGDAIVAGSTYSDDFPTTPGALQSTSTATGTVTLRPDAVPSPTTPPPPTSGFISKLNAAGSGLVWSTLFSGTREDSVSSLSVAPDLSIYIAGLAGSADLPGLQSAPGGCRPKFLQFVPYVAHLTEDASAIFSASLFGDAVSAVVETPIVVVTASSQVAGATPGPPLAGSLGQNVAVPGAELASLDLDAASPVSCIVDAADTAPISNVAPGQLITIFGQGLAVDCGATANGFPTTYCNASLTFNGIPAPLLYVYGNQVNAQVPFEVSAAGTVTMRYTSQIPGQPDVKVTQVLRVVPASPALFLSAETTPLCGPPYVQGFDVLVPLARNADGSINSACNPAKYGSTVTLYVNGSGSLGAAATTGTTAPAPAVPLNLNITNIDTLDLPATVSAVTTMPGSISGLVQLQLKIPLSTEYYFSQVNLNLGSIPFREQAAVIWVK